jgi:hypothetical protein
MTAEDLAGLPGAELVTQGLEDLACGKTSEFSLLLLVAEPRLRPLGLEINTARLPITQPSTYALYDYLEARADNDAHSQYNSLLRRMDSLANALERESSRALADAAKLTTPSG